MKIDNFKFEEFYRDGLYRALESPLKLWSNKQSFSFLIDILFLKLFFFSNRNKDSFIVIKSFIFTLFNLPFMVFLVNWLLIKIISIFASPTIETCTIANFVEPAFFLVMLKKNDLPIFWVPAFSLIYWNLRKKFSEQWMYCAGLYNKISFESMHDLDPDEILYQRCTLALDLIQTDLYSHASFCTVFNIALEKSIHYVYKHRKDEIEKIYERKNMWHNTPSSTTAILEIQKFKNGRGSTLIAAGFISVLQQDLDDAILEGKLASS